MGPAKPTSVASGKKDANADPVLLAPGGGNTALVVWPTNVDALGAEERLLKSKTPAEADWSWSRHAAATKKVLMNIVFDV